MSRMLAEQNTPALGSLTAVIPIAHLIQNLPNIENTLIKANENNIKIIAVVDLAAQGINPIDEVLSNLREKFEGDAVRIEEGFFGNPGDARNFGKSLCQTEWITFWDADDQPICNEIRNILNSDVDDVETIIGGYSFNVNEHKKIVKTSSMTDLGYDPGFWRILFRTKMISNAQFPNKKMGEDQLFLARCQLDQRKILFVENIFYVYQTDAENRLSQSKLAYEELASLTTIFENEFTPSQSTEYVRIMLLRMKISLLLNSTFILKLKIMRQKSTWTLLFSKNLLKIITRKIK